MKCIRIACVVAVLVLGTLGRSSRADVISTFDSGPDGWTLQSDVSWQAVGGNPGGYLQNRDSGPGFIHSIFAPPAYLGDLTEYFGGTLSFDFRVFQTALPTFSRTIVLSGTSGVAGWTGPSFGGPVDWTNVSAELSEDEWNVITGTDFVSILQEVTQIEIRLADHNSALTGFLEITGIDNIRLAAVVVPESHSLVLAAFSVAAVGFRRSRN